MPEDNVQDDNKVQGRSAVCVLVCECDLEGRRAGRRGVRFARCSAPRVSEGRCARPWFAFTAYKVSSAFCGVAPAAQHASRLPLPPTDHPLLHAVNYNRLGCCSTQSILVKCGGEAGFGSQGWGEGRAPWSSDRRPPPAASQPQHQHGAGGPALSPSSLRQGQQQENYTVESDLGVDYLMCGRGRNNVFLNPAKVWLCGDFVHVTKEWPQPGGAYQIHWDFTQITHQRDIGLLNFRLCWEKVLGSCGHI
ncbi:hypothetical protein LSTR_LSTR005755 [Laodelphax striatellus]|uniref:Uncharacterized protein n=1 Tax=Laodelphax striatellus TaxID=195883 RepID=A0A482XIA0_LAOST|nr:hypothetical protein LSTR_LSTR005755 [Laodelphax striatellus]